MKSFIFAAIVALALGAVILSAAAPAQSDSGPSAIAPTTQAAAPTTQASAPINQFCPINRDNPIDPKVTYVYQGKTIGFCCPDCIAEFKKDPARYMKDLK